jgi:hypothetical protein
MSSFLGHKLEDCGRAPALCRMQCALQSALNISEQEIQQHPRCLQIDPASQQSMYLAPRNRYIYG